MNISQLIRKIPRVIRSQWRHFEYNLSRKISLDWFDIARYQLLMGERPNLKNPKTWSEKLLWLNKHWQPDIKAELTDKLRVRDYLIKEGLEHLLVPLIGSWENPDEIDFDMLPNQFALKCNHGSATNIICADKSKLNIDEVRRKLAYWLSVDYGKLYNEKHYSKIKPMILCEEYLPAFENASSVIDYKLHCFNGEPQFFLICSDRDVETHSLTLSSYSLNWEQKNYLVHEGATLNNKLAQPKNLQQMIEYARVLSKNIAYVRVDFYEINEKLYFGELTFTPAANVMGYYRLEFQKEVGPKLNLSELVF